MRLTLLGLVGLVGCGGGGGGGNPAPSRELDGLLDVRFQNESRLITRLKLFPVVCRENCPPPDFRPGCGSLLCVASGPEITAYDGGVGIPFVDVPSLPEGSYNVLVTYEAGGIRNDCFVEGSEFLEIEAQDDQLVSNPCTPFP